MNYLVETKIEYTTQLINIIAPYVYEGIVSIYNEAKKIANKNEELKIFQTFLRKIPKWNKNLIDNETKRIVKESTCGDILEELIKAVIKSNIMLLTNTPPEKKSKLKINYVIELPIFIHNVYIESARNIFQNPFLFYHDYTSFELKKNQRDAINLIKTSVNEAIRKMLPLNLILKEFLGNSFTDQNIEEEEIDKHISEQQKTKLMQMLKNENEDGLAYSISSASKQKSSAKKNPDILNNYTLSSIKRNKSNKSNSRNIPGMQDNDETSALYEPPNPNDIKESYSNKNQVEPIFESGNMLSHISEHNVTFNNAVKQNKEIKQEEKINKIKSIIDSEIEKSITYNGTFGTNIKLQKI